MCVFENQDLRVWCPAALKIQWGPFEILSEGPVDPQIAEYVMYFYGALKILHGEDPVWLGHPLYATGQAFTIFGQHHFPDSKVHVAHMGPTWDLSAPGGSHVGPINLAIRVA